MKWQKKFHEFLFDSGINVSVLAYLNLLVMIFFDNLIYGNLQGDIVVASVTAVLIDPKFCCGHCLSIWDLSQVKTELLVVSSLVRKIFIFLHWEKKKKITMNFCITAK